jgi:cytoskeleton protein RodZ
VPLTGLKEAREKKGITLAEVSHALKISKAYLNALEMEDFDYLPEPVFARGYIKSYCQYLEVDSREIFDKYNDFLSSKEPVTYEPLRATPVKERRRIRLAGMPTWILSIAALVFLIVSVLSYQIKKEKNKMELRAKLETEFAHNASDVVDDTEKQADEPVASDVGGDSEKGQLSRLTGDREEGGGGERDERAQDQGLNLNLEAQELTWLYVVPDNGSPIDVTLYPGDRLRIRAKKTIKFKLGNAGGVSAVLNGKKLSPLGKSGEVVEKTFTAGVEE